MNSLLTECFNAERLCKHIITSHFARRLCNHYTAAGLDITTTAVGQGHSPPINPQGTGALQTPPPVPLSRWTRLVLAQAVMKDKTQHTLSRSIKVLSDMCSPRCSVEPFTLATCHQMREHVFKTVHAQSPANVPAHVPMLTNVTVHTRSTFEQHICVQSEN